MPLKIETFDNSRGGNSFYKAVTHPLAARRAAELLRRLEAAGKVAVYDPLGFLAGFAEFYDLSRVALAGTYVQDIAAIGRPLLGRPGQPVTDLPDSGAQLVVEAMLQSPNFLFRLEDTANPMWKPFATASRLSYALWDSMPDDTLMTAAARGELNTQEGVLRSARSAPPRAAFHSTDRLRWPQRPRWASRNSASRSRCRISFSIRTTALRMRHTRTGRCAFRS